MQARATQQPRAQFDLLCSDSTRESTAGKRVQSGLAGFGIGVSESKFYFIFIFILYLYKYICV